MEISTLQILLGRLGEQDFQGAPSDIQQPLDASKNNNSDFNSLSLGARQKMGLISRLSYVDLLKEAGRPTLIILDDALAL